MRYSRFLFFIFLLTTLACDQDPGLQSEAQGQGGSMTRFAISGNTLYVVDQTQIKVFTIDGNVFRAESEVYVNPGIETIFVNGEYLYLGANDAMYIYSIAERTNPSFVFRYTHIYACDPVIVQGNRAYVTLRTDTRCHRGENTLESLDISDPNNPKLLFSYPMSSPHGLAIDNNLLLVCEGDFGLKAFNVKDGFSPVEVARLTGFSAYDVIMHNGIATITGEDGIFQYSYNNTASGELKLVSQIPVTRATL